MAIYSNMHLMTACKLENTKLETESCGILSTCLRPRHYQRLLQMLIWVVKLEGEKKKKYIYVYISPPNVVLN